MTGNKHFTSSDVKEYIYSINNYIESMQKVSNSLYHSIDYNFLMQSLTHLFDYVNKRGILKFTCRNNIISVIFFFLYYFENKVSLSCSY